MNDDPAPNPGVAAILATHASPGSPCLRFDSCWLGRRDLASLGADASLADAAEVVVGFDALRSDGAPSITEERTRLSALGATHVLPIGDCGALGAEMTERGWVMPGDLVVGRGPAGHGIGGIGALYVEVDDPAVAARAGNVETELGRSHTIQLVGSRERWVDAIDLAFGIAEQLDRRGIGGGPLDLVGPGLLELAASDRIVLCGALGALRAAPVVAEIDAHVIAWLRARAQRVPDLDLAARLVPPADLTIDVGTILPGVGSWKWNVHAVCDAPYTPISTVLVGGALGARLEDLRVITRMFREHPIDSRVTCVVVPATPRALLHAAHEGLIPVLLRAGVRIEAPGSRSFIDLSRAIGDDGAALTTVFDERLDPPWSLVAPAVAAASAVLGRVAHPDEVLRRRKESV